MIPIVDIRIGSKAEGIVRAGVPFSLKADICHVDRDGVRRPSFITSSNHHKTREVTLERPWGKPRENVLRQVTVGLGVMVQTTRIGPGPLAALTHPRISPHPHGTTATCYMSYARVLNPYRPSAA